MRSGIPLWDSADETAINHNETQAMPLLSCLQQPGVDAGLPIAYPEWEFQWIDSRNPPNKLSDRMTRVHQEISLKNNQSAWLARICDCRIFCLLAVSSAISR
jgi:hypothetical protein